MNSPFDDAKYQALLEGLEVSELMLSEVLANVDFRIDAEFHRKMPADNPRYEYVPIAEVLNAAQYGISIEMNEDDNGFPIYRMNEIENMLCSSEVLKCAAIDEIEAKPFFLSDGDVLFNRTNSQVFVGRTGLYKPFDNEPRVFASYLVRLIANRKKVLPEYLTTFLNSSLGVLDVQRRARISINQSNVNAQEVKAVRIPLFDLGLQEKIAECFVVAHKALIQSNDLYAQAETLLLETLNLRDWHPPRPHAYESTLSAAFAANRLDAEYFQPQHAALLEHLQKHAPRVRRIRDFAAHCDRGQQPEYCSAGELSVVNSRHILENGLDYDNFERTDAKFWNDLRFHSARIEKHDILTYMTGANVGRTSVFLGTECALASNEVNILRVFVENPIYVAVVVNSMIGRMQTRRSGTGSAQVHLYPSDIADFVVPFVGSEIEFEIAAQVESSHAARRRAKGLLEAAKRAVEIAIEDDEAAALEFLEAAQA